MTCVAGEWHLDDIRIYVEKDSGWKVDPRRGKIDVLDSTQTIVHCAGRPGYTRSIQFVVFSGYFNQILPMAELCSGVELCSDIGIQGYIIVDSFNPERLQALNHPNPVYRVTMECTKRGT